MEPAPVVALGFGMAQVLGSMSSQPDSLDYQAGLRPDFSPIGVGGRMLRHYGFSLLPLEQTPWRELAAPAVLPALAVFWAALALVVAREDEPSTVRPNTLLILVDRTQSWRSFGLRHAVEYMYEGRASGYLWGSETFLHSTELTDAGVVCRPHPAIRGPWRSLPTIHRYHEVVLVRYAADGGVAIVDRWPSRLRVLPARAAYDPRARILGAAVEPRSRAVLR